MTVDADQIEFSRKSQLLVDEFFEELPNFKGEEWVEARAERSLNNYRSRLAISPHALRHEEASAEHASSFMEALWTLAIPSSTELDKNKLRHAIFLELKDHTRNQWQTNDFHDLAQLQPQLISKDLAFSPAPADRKPTVGGSKTSSNSIRVVSLGRMHATMWVGLVFFALFWGIVAGAAFFAGAGATPSVATFGVLGTVALSVTLYMLSVQNALRKYGK